MITHNDQLELFRLVGSNLKKDVECYAFGGNAMMFYGYKSETKDIDLFFENVNVRDHFIDAIKSLGYKETSLIGVYSKERIKEKSAPLMFKRGESRFDLFAKKIFRIELSPKMKEDVYAVHDFKGNKNLRLYILRKEFIVLLKGITNRERDFEDIVNIIKKEKDFDWQYFVDEVKWQHENGDEWIIIDIEKMMQQLKDYTLIEEKYFNQLYKTQQKSMRRQHEKIIPMKKYVKKEVKV